MKDVCLVILNWNTKQLLLECIESIKKDTKKSSYEIIVVDNASSDGSVAALKDTFKDVKLIENNANLGFAAGNNVGIKQASARYICLINTDIVALDGVIDKMVSHMDANPDIGAMIPKNLNEQMQIRPCARDFPSLRNTFTEATYLNEIFSEIRIFRGKHKPISFFNKNQIVDTIPCSFFMMPKKALDAVGLLDERFFIYSEDVDWCKRFWNAGWKVVYYADAQVIHYGSVSARVSPAKFFIEQMISELQYWKKHHGIIKSFLYRCICILRYSLRIVGSMLLLLLQPTKWNVTRQKTKSFGLSLLFLFTNKGPRMKPKSLNN